MFTVVELAEGKAIRISGEVFGELRTRAAFADYRLRLQFTLGEKKWPPRDNPKMPRDSGILYHVPAVPGEENRGWARSIELQIQERDVGDLCAVGSEIAVRSRRREQDGKVFWITIRPGSGRCFPRWRAKKAAA